jgi:hypothetical protein
MNPDVDLEDGWRGDGQALGYSLSQGLGGARPSRLGKLWGGGTNLNLPGPVAWRVSGDTGAKMHRHGPSLTPEGPRLFRRSA